MQDRAIVTTAHMIYRSIGAYDLLIGTVFNDLEPPVTQISKARRLILLIPFFRLRGPVR